MSTTKGEDWQNFVPTGKIRQEELIVQRSSQDCTNSGAERLVLKWSYILLRLIGDSQDADTHKAADTDLDPRTDLDIPQIKGGENG